MIAMKKEEGRKEGGEGCLLVYSLTILITMKKEEGRESNGDRWTNCRGTDGQIIVGQMDKL